MALQIVVVKIVVAFSENSDSEPHSILVMDLAGVPVISQ